MIVGALKYLHPQVGIVDLFNSSMSAKFKRHLRRIRIVGTYIHRNTTVIAVDVEARERIYYAFVCRDGSSCDALIIEVYLRYNRGVTVTTR